MKKLLGTLGLLCVVSTQASDLEINPKTVKKICKLGVAAEVGAVTPHGDINVVNIQFSQEDGLLQASGQVDLLVNCGTKKARLEYSTYILLNSEIQKECPLPPLSADWEEKFEQESCLKAYVEANPSSKVLSKRVLKSNEYFINDDGGLVFDIKNTDMGFTYNYSNINDEDLRSRGLDGFMFKVKSVQFTVEKDDLHYESVEDESSNQYLGTTVVDVNLDTKKFFKQVNINLQKQGLDLGRSDSMADFEPSQFDILSIDQLGDARKISLEAYIDIQPAVFSKAVIHPMSSEDEFYNHYVSPSQVDLNDIFEFITK